MEDIKIFIIDENKIFNYGIKSFFERENTNITIAGEAFSFKESINAINRTLPDIIITDFFILLKEEGLEFLEYVNNQYQDTKFLIFSSQIDREYILKAIQLGIYGILSKHDDIGDLATAINHIHANKKFFGDSILTEMVNLIRDQNKVQTKTPQKNVLTLREIEILKHIIDGMTSKDIAQLLQISVRTVNNHRYNIMTKLEVKNTAALIKVSMEQNLLS